MRDCLIGGPATIGIHPKSRVRVPTQSLDNLDVPRCAQLDLVDWPIGPFLELVNHHPDAVDADGV